MSFVISSLQPFPSIQWWCHVLDADMILWDLAEHFEKMSYRNRYAISTANGLVKLSVPLQGGRDQRSSVKDILVSNVSDWQTQHWRTLVSAYNRSPFFEFYSPSLESLFKDRRHTLVDFNLSSIHWLKTQLRVEFIEEKVLSYKKDYPDAAHDLRKRSSGVSTDADTCPTYNQVFMERTGFLPNLSLLDLLFAEGPHTLQWLKAYRGKV